MMKRFIILSLLITLVSVTATAQTWQYITNPGTTGRIRGNVVTDSVQFFSGGFPVVPSYLNSFPGFKIVGDSAKRYSPTSHTWVPFGSESTAWGNIPGIISTQTDLMAILNAKQNKLPIGTTAQYYDGTLALKNFKNDVNGAIDTFRTATRGRLYKVVDSLLNATTFVDPYGVVSATVTQPTPFSKLLTINRVNGTSVTASWPDSANALNLDSIGWVAQGPYLQVRHAGSMVGNRDTVYVDEDALRTLIESYISGSGDFTPHPEFLDSLAAIRAAMTDSNFAVKDLTNWTGTDRYHNFRNKGLRIDSLSGFEFDFGAGYFGADQTGGIYGYAPVAGIDLQTEGLLNVRAAGNVDITSHTYGSISMRSTSTQLGWNNTTLSLTEDIAKLQNSNFGVGVYLNTGAIQIGNLSAAGDLTSYEGIQVEGSGRIDFGQYHTGNSDPEEVFQPATDDIEYLSIDANSRLKQVKRLYVKPTLLVTPVAGYLESDGTHLYWTNGSGVRKQLDN